MTMKIAAFATAFLMLATACQQAPGALAGREAELLFLDSEVFDEQMAQAMRQQAAVVAVEMVQDISPNRVPERLDRWFYAIQSNGGEVRPKVDPTIPQERSAELVVAAIRLGVEVYQLVKEQRRYAAAKGYGALVHIDPANDRITRVLFVRVSER